MFPPFDRMPNPRDAYWIVEDHPNLVYSSRTNTYIAEGFFGGDLPFPKVTDEADLWHTQLHTIKPEWLYDIDAGTFSQPAEGMYSMPQLVNYSQLRRFETENGGMMTSGGIPVRTDERAKIIITMAHDAALPSFKMIAADGTVHNLNQLAIDAVFGEVTNFVATVHEAHANLVTQINGGFVTTPAEIDAIYDAIPNSNPSLPDAAKRRIARKERPW